MANTLSALIFPGAEFASPGASAPGDAASVGTANTISRSDHKHGREAALVPATTVGSGTSFGTASLVGTSVNYAREDHNHGTPSLSSTAPSTESFGASAVVGTGTTAARADHAHALPTPVTTFTTTGAGLTALTNATGAVSISNTGVVSLNGSTGAVTGIADLASTQTFAGAKTFSSALLGTAGVYDGATAVAGNRVYSANNAPPYPVTSVAGRTGAVVVGPADIATGTLPGTYTISGNLTVNGQFLTGTRSVFTGTRAVTTNASDTVDIGTFTTTGGAMELRVHAHLAAPSSGATASVTKIYELATNATIGTAATWYLSLPADASANAAATNDFALEVNRTSGSTFSLRLRQKSIGVAGIVTYTIEALGDTAVTFVASTTVTAAPAAVTLIHPSNAFVAAAGNVGIGTESPTSLLTVGGAITATTLNTTGNLSENGARVYSANNPPPVTAGVASITGTANQITASASTGAVTLSLPSTLTAPGSLTVTTTLGVTGLSTLASTSLTTIPTGAGVERLNYGLRGGFLITGGGTLTYDATPSFGWTARFIIISGGNSASSGTSGYFDIAQPTSGAVTVLGGAAARNWSAAGVTIGPWEALWYTLPIGSTNTSVPANFFVTSYTSAMTPPSSDAVLLAWRNGDDQYLRTCRGNQMLSGYSIVAGGFSAGTLLTSTLNFVGGPSLYSSGSGTLFSGSDIQTVGGRHLYAGSPTSGGAVAMISGDGTNTGFTTFISPNGTRQGYIGNGPSGTVQYGGTIIYQAGIHQFGGYLAVGNNKIGAGQDFALIDAGTAGTNATRVFSSGGNAYIDINNSFLLRNRVASQIMSIDQSGNLNTNGSIQSNAASLINGTLTVWSQGNFTSAAASSGAVSIVGGNTGGSGYIAFGGTNGIRQGYIGDASTANQSGTTDGGIVTYGAGRHQFNGQFLANSGITLGVNQGTIAGAPQMHGDGTNIYLETNGAGNIFLRPNGNSNTGMVWIDSNGRVNAPGGIATFATYAGQGRLFASGISGSSVITTDSGGNVTITHGLGLSNYVPSIILMMGTAGGIQNYAVLTGVTSTTASFRFYNSGGTALVISNVTAYWTAVPY